MQKLNIIGRWFIHFVVCIALITILPKVIFTNFYLQDYPFLYFLLYQFILIPVLWFMIKNKEKTSFLYYIIPTFLTFLIILISTMLYTTSCSITIPIPFSYVIWIYIYNAFVLGVLIYDFFKNRSNKPEYILYVPVTVIIIHIIELGLAYTTTLGLIPHITLFFKELMGWM